MKKRIVAGTILILFISFVLISFFGNPIKKQQARDTIYAYLIDEMKYTSEEIYKVKGISSKSDSCKYGASVTFNDEREYPYYIYVCNDGKIVSGGYTSPNPKHSNNF